MRLIDADNLIKTLISAKYFGADSFAKIQNSEIDRCVSFVETEPTVPTVCSTRIASVVDLFGNRIEGYFDESRMLFFSGYGIVTAELIKQKNYKLIFEKDRPRNCKNCVHNVQKDEGRGCELWTCNFEKVGGSS